MEREHSKILVQLEGIFYNGHFENLEFFPSIVALRIEVVSLEPYFYPTISTLNSLCPGFHGQEKKSPTMNGHVKKA
jgi:hypothetical protein